MTGTMLPAAVLIGKRRGSGKDTFALRLSRWLKNPYLMRFAGALKGTAFSNLGCVDAFYVRKDDNSRKVLIDFGTHSLERLGAWLYANQTIEAFHYAASQHLSSSVLIVPDWRYHREFEAFIAGDIEAQFGRSLSRVWSKIVLVWLRPVGVSKRGNESIDNHPTEDDSDMDKIQDMIVRNGLSNKVFTLTVDVDYSSPRRVEETREKLKATINTIRVVLGDQYTLAKPSPPKVYLATSITFPDGWSDCEYNTNVLSHAASSYGLHIINGSTLLNRPSIVDLIKEGGIERFARQTVAVNHQLLTQSHAVIVDWRGAKLGIGVAEEMVLGKMLAKPVVSIVDPNLRHIGVGLHPYIHYYSDLVTDDVHHAMKHISELLD
jgi:hypothetical protein